MQSRWLALHLVCVKQRTSTANATQVDTAFPRAIDTLTHFVKSIDVCFEDADIQTSIYARFTRVFEVLLALARLMLLEKLIFERALRPEVAR